MSKQKVNASAVAVIVCVALFLFSSCFLLYFSTTNTQDVVAVFSSGNTSQGSFEMEVLDATTNKPVANATIVLPQVNKTYTTNEQGKTKEIRVPIFVNSNFDSIQKQDWGNVCVLIYADGYIPYALFDMNIEANKKRLGPKILLFPENSTDSNQPFSIIESPKRTWVNALVEKYQP